MSSSITSISEIPFDCLYIQPGAISAVYKDSFWLVGWLAGWLAGYKSDNFNSCVNSPATDVKWGRSAGRKRGVNLRLYGSHLLPNVKALFSQKE
jgi:hypothetical protein